MRPGSFHPFWARLWGDSLDRVESSIHIKDAMYSVEDLCNCDRSIGHVMLRYWVLYCTTFSNVRNLSRTYERGGIFDLMEV